MVWEFQKVDTLKEITLELSEGESFELEISDISLYLSSIHYITTYSDNLTRLTTIQASKFNNDIRSSLVKIGNIMNIHFNLIVSSNIVKLQIINTESYSIGILLKQFIFTRV